jgi:hypothetical protein
MMQARKSIVTRDPIALGRAYEILGMWNEMPEDRRGHLAISFAIVRRFMGHGWLKKHLNPDPKNRSIFRLSDDKADAITSRHRLVDLAQCLINLYLVDGMQELLSNMKKAENPEGQFAELHIAKMLYVNKWPFQIVPPSIKRGKSYDLKITYHDQTMCGETKCKIESTDISSKTIFNSLQTGRNQLPPDGPGVFFVKFPRSWMKHPNWKKITRQGVMDFFKGGTQRVVSVVLYVDTIHYDGKGIEHVHHFVEIVNPHHKMGKLYDWRLFERWQSLPGSKGETPPHWVKPEQVVAHLIRSGG